MSRTALSTIVLSVAALGASVARPAWCDPVDERELREMRQKSPHAVELFEKAEALASTGSTQEAQALFHQAESEAPDASILWRRDCEMLIAMGRRKEALSACASAVGAFHTGPNVQALVSAFVDGPNPPTPMDVSQAIMITAAEKRHGPSLTVAAAACDIAERIGDEAMLQQCTEELQKFDPNDPATRKARSMLEARCPPWRFWSGWGALAAGIAFTLGHAARRRLRRRSRTTMALAAGLSFALAMAPGSSRAEDPPAPSGQFHAISKWPIDDAHPDSNIPTEAQRNAEPLQFGYWLQDLVAKGTHAAALGDHAAAARYFEATAKAVPDRAIGYVKTCEEYEALGERDKAIAYCGEALLQEGLTVADYTHFVHLMLSKPGTLDQKDTAALANILAHMREDSASRDYVDDLECEVGTRTSNVAQLKECTAGLSAKEPEAKKTVTYLWALAVADGQIGEARDLIERAGVAGVQVDELSQMRKATDAAAMKRLVRTGLLAVALALLAAGVAYALRAMRERRKGNVGVAPAAPAEG